MNRSSHTRLTIACLVFGLILIAESATDPTHAQSGRKGHPSAGSLPQVTGTDEGGTLRIDTTLVSIPVTVLDREGRYVPALRREDFLLFEDDVRQEIETFESVETPFQVALLLDTSGSTESRLREIQRAAIEFVELLRADDRIMISSFDDSVYLDADFTNDRRKLRRAIENTHTGQSTRLYDAVDLAITEKFSQIEGRKAIVLFTDGVDTESREATAQGTLELVEESGVLVYPIRYNTENDQRRTFSGRAPSGRRGRWPGPAARWPGRGRGNGDYEYGAEYLKLLADRSAGRLYNADTMGSLAQAFYRIAEELRHQYRLSYYPASTAQDGTWRKIRVRVNQPGLVVRAREGYRAGNSSETERSERPLLRRTTP